MIEFTKVRGLNNKFQYESRGEFRKNATFLRIVKELFTNKWSLIVFFDNELKGSVYCTCDSLKDVKEIANMYFSL